MQTTKKPAPLPEPLPLRKSLVDELASPPDREVITNDDIRRQLGWDLLRRPRFDRD